MNQAEKIRPGTVSVERQKDGWLLVLINRGRYVKRFNLRDSEAAQLVEHLARIGGVS
jgi:hypothetical protein